MYKDVDTSLEEHKEELQINIDQREVRLRLIMAQRYELDALIDYCKDRTEHMVDDEKEVLQEVATMKGKVELINQLLEQRKAEK